ncbi:Dynein heavy chain [Sergentomyia squamirostris]
MSKKVEFAKNSIKVHHLKPLSNPHLISRLKCYSLNESFSKEFTKRQRNIFSLPQKELTHLKTTKSTRSKLSVKYEKKKSYTALRIQREKFRVRILELITRGKSNDFKSGFPSTKDEEFFRFYHYIQHGIDTVHIASLDKKVLSRILCLIPKRLSKYVNILDGIISEMKNEYFTAMKKSVIDYVLQDSMPESLAEEKSNWASQTKRIVTNCGHHFKENRTKLMKSLFTVNPCMSQMLELWHTNFQKLSFVDLVKLTAHEKPYDLLEFTATVLRQIDETKSILKNDWYNLIKNIIVRGVKRNIVPKFEKKRLIRKFFNATATIMEQNLQDVCVNSLNIYCHYITDLNASNKRFNLTILLEEEDTLVFSPSFFKIEAEILRVIDYIIKTVKAFPRIESLFDLPDFSSNPCLQPIIADVTVADCRHRILRVLEDQRIGPELRMQDFDDYITLMNGAAAEEIEQFIGRKPKFEEYCEQILHYKNIEGSITRNISGVIILGLYEFHREGLIETLEKLARFMQNELITNLTAQQQTEISNFAKEYESISIKARKIPKDTRELMELKKYVQEMEESKIPEMEQKLRQNMKELLWLFDHTIFTPLEIKQNSLTFQWYLKMPSVFKEHKQIIAEKTLEYQEGLRRRIETFRRDLEVYWEQVQDYENWGDIKHLAKYKRKATLLDNKLMSAQEKINQVNEEERSYMWEESEFPLRNATYEKLVPHKNLFDAGQDFMDKYEVWMHTQVGTFEPSIIDNDVSVIYKTIMTLEKLFVDSPNTQKLTQDIKEVVDEFKTHMPIVRTLGNSGMKERHWEQVSEIIGFPIKISTDLTLERIIEYGLDDYISKFQVISESATKENNLEKAMTKMVDEWTDMAFTINPYRDSGTFILSAIDDIQILLDDHIIKTQTMKNSPYIKPFAKEILAWETTLVLLQDILDSWLKVQSNWMYLEPIFSSPDIQQHMPEEGRRFSAVDKIWKDLMKQVAVDTKVMAVVEIEKMSDRLKKAFNLLEVIQKGLNAYLEKKRLHFSRFFFLSNEELLEILSETKDPTMIQNHLKKCFEGIAMLTFTEELDVTKMNSYHGEEIELVEVIATAKSRGQVEKWLTELEDVMKKTVLKSLQNAYSDCKRTPRDSWILLWPGQAVINVSRISWTHSVEKNLGKDLKSLEDRWNDSINQDAQSLKETTTERHRMTLTSMIISDIHCRDVIKHLQDEKISNPKDFSWIAQVRYYWSQDLILKTLDASLGYSHEYLGNTNRLIITPQTDRCWRSTFIALQYNFSCCYQGSTSTGKTETIKDLAKTVGKQCIIFYCSNTLDFVSFGKFFKGLASCGAWCCFKDFNNVTQKILSVVSQQILTLQRSIAAKASTVIFDGTQLSLNPTCALFVTLAQKTPNCVDLPDSLKVLFRPVSFTNPHSRMIIETELFAAGFQRGKALATKLITLFDLSKELLTKETHYDFGLRTIKTILRVTVNLTKTKEASEDGHFLQAIKNVCLSKFKEIDAQIFKEILGDLFPTEPITTPITEYHEKMRILMAKVFEKNNKVFTDYSLEKSLQFIKLLDQMPGIVITGGPFGGKTTNYRLLAEALRTTDDGEVIEDRLSYVVINPKAITLEKLYGTFDVQTFEWSDGIFSHYYRKYAGSKTDGSKWIVFDGPIDTSWMDNLNTVMDDNRKLCLASGEIINLKKNMKIIFETEDLRAASPATISRCGIVYIEPDQLGWKPLLESWENTLPPTFTDIQKNDIRDLFMRFCPILLWFIRQPGIHEMLTTQDSNILVSITNLFDCFLKDYEDKKHVDSLSEFDIRSQLEGIFFFSCVWAVGGSLNGESRGKFSIIFRGLLEKKFPTDLYETFGIPEHLRVPDLSRAYIFPIPKAESVFDYRYIKEGKGKWKLWSDEIAQAPPIPRDMPVNQIIISTAETIRIWALLDLLANNSKQILLVGQTGTGKSVYTLEFLAKKLNANLFKHQFLCFSDLTTANQTQEIVMSKLDKRRKGVFGPPLGRQCVIFIDDLSMPVRESCGAQPPIELLRMWMDHRMWYDQAENVPIKLIDIQMICAMGAKGVGNPITPRFTRHFNTIAIDNFVDETLKAIFSKIVLWHLDTRGFSKEFDPCIEEIVLSTLDIYNRVKLKLQATPKRPHYIFNLRDFARVVQGVLLSVPEAIEDLSGMRRLWFHEVLRIYGDRLVDPEDRNWLFESLCEIAESCMKTTAQELLERFSETSDSICANDMRKLIYCDFTNPKADTKNYIEVQDIDELTNVVESYQVEYNNMSKKPMDLILFRFAIEHLSRICRILKQPRSHALLIGLDGSGRQSLSRLASHIVDYELFQVEITKKYDKDEWRLDIKNILKRISTNELHGVFLVTDKQNKEETFMEEINNLLICGEVPNIFSPEDKEELIERMRQIDSQKEKSLQTDGTPVALFNYFVRFVREQLHIVLCMSPVGSTLRTRIRKFPSIVNCCTVNWFQEWPEDAMVFVASRYLASIIQDPTVRTHYVDSFIFFHNSTKAVSDEMAIRMQRQNYITPIIYIELIQNFKSMLQQKQIMLTAKRNKYLTGIKQLTNAAEQIKITQEQLEVLEPKLKTTSEIVTEQGIKVQAEFERLVIQKEGIKRDEAITAEKASAVTKIKEEISSKLGEVLPDVEAAIDALTTLTPADILIVKSMKNPPQAVKVVLEGICILRDIKPDKVPGQNDDYWSPSKRLLSEPAFLESLIQFDKNTVTPKIMEVFQQRPVLSFDMEKVKSISMTCEILFKWVLAIANYGRVLESLEPRKQALIEAEAIYNTAIDSLNIKLEQLASAEVSLADLQSHHDAKQEEFRLLQNEFEASTKKLQRANELINTLESEKDGWQAIADALEASFDKVAGDMIISAGIVSYMGAFSVEFREKLLKMWLQQIDGLEIKHTVPFRIDQCLEDAAQIRQWNINGLPSESHPIENAIIIKYSKRWPLLIDPQFLANNWIKSLEKENRLCVIRFNQPDYNRVLENSIQFGLPVLIENVGEELDPMLEPILKKQIFKQGGVYCMKLGENIIEFNDAFRLFISTKLYNPRIAPDVAVDLKIINFVITREGLNNQVVSATIGRERPDLESERNQIVMQRGDTEKQLRDIEENILDILSTEKEILENDKAVQNLSSSKILLNEVQEKHLVAKNTEKQLEDGRVVYTQIADHCSTLFFSVDQLNIINPMYQFNLKWFISNYLTAIDNTEKLDDINARLQGLKKYFTKSFYISVCQSLFSKDKLVLALILASNINEYDRQKWMFLLTGATTTKVESTKPDCDFLTPKTWNEICNVATFDDFSALPVHISHNLETWENLLNNDDPEKGIPEPWNTDLDDFHKMVLLRCLRKDILIHSVRKFVEKTLGKEFIDPPLPTMESCFEASNACTPIIVILEEGYDFTETLLKFAETKGIIDDKIVLVTLGKGQGELAEKMIEEGMKSGSWVVLFNCHLANNWMNNLEGICDAFTTDSTHPDFRIWLTSLSTHTFPSSLLENSVKITKELTDGLKRNLVQKFNHYSKKDDQEDFQRILYNLCCFHSVVLERKNYKENGWNIHYDFIDLDLSVSIRNLRKFTETQEFSLETLFHIVGSCNYEERVSDLWDQRLLKTIFKTLITNTVQNAFAIPEDVSEESFKDFLSGFKIRNVPNAIGLHRNACIVKDQEDTENFLTTVLMVQDRNDLVRLQEHNLQDDVEKLVKGTSEEILNKLPEIFDLQSVEEKFPKSYEESRNFLLLQELQQYNKLMTFIGNQLRNVIKCIEGKFFITFCVI